MPVASKEPVNQLWSFVVGYHSLFRLLFGHESDRKFSRLNSFKFVISRPLTANFVVLVLLIDEGLMVTYLLALAGSCLIVVLTTSSYFYIIIYIYAYKML